MVTYRCFLPSRVWKTQHFGKGFTRVSVFSSKPLTPVLHISTLACSEFLILQKVSTKYFHTVAFPQRSCIRVHKKTESMGKRFIPGSGSRDSGAWKSCHLPSRSWRPRTGGDGIIPFRGLKPGAPCQRAGDEDRELALPPPFCSIQALN